MIFYFTGALLISFVLFRLGFYAAIIAIMTTASKVTVALLLVAALVGEHKIPGAKFKQITLNRLLCVASQVSLSVNAVMLSGISLEYLSTINTRTISAIKNLQLVHCSLLFFKSICAISDTLIASTPSATGYRLSPA